MLDALSLDQLRTFIIAAREGSFSAAGRRLMRAQSAVSQTIAKLEALLGVSLFDRSGRSPVLTAQGRMLLSDAQAIMASIDGLKAKAKSMAQGLEPELSVVVDVMFPITAVTQAARAFAIAFPTVPLRLYVEALGGVVQHVLDGRCSLGIIGSWPEVPHTLRTERLVGMAMVMVVSPHHPLAAVNAPVERSELARYTQIILTDRTGLSNGRTFGVMAPNTWKLADLGAKHAFLLDGLGWGAMPMATVEDDLANGRLVRLLIEDQSAEVILPMAAAYPIAAPPGPAGRWLIDTLRTCSRAFEAANADEETTSPPSPAF